VKRLIILKTINYLHTPAERKGALTQFRHDLKDLPYIKIIQEIEQPSEPPQAVVEFPDDQVDHLYRDLAKVAVVLIIDGFLPKSAKEKVPDSIPEPSGKRVLTIDDIKRLGNKV
jgi:hypothetical protein